MAEISQDELNAEVVQEEVIEKTTEELEIEDRARRMGWRPKEEFDRPPSRWVDAQTFLDRGERELPVLRERYRKIDTELATTKQELTTVKQTVLDQKRSMDELLELSRSAEERAYVRAQREFSDRERRAVEAADTAAYEAVQRDRQDLETTRRRAPPMPAQAASAPQAPPAAPPANPVAEAWVADNPWFNTDPVLNQMAIAFDRQIKGDHPDWSVSEQLAEVKRQVVARFPEKFGNPRRQAPPAVATPNNAPPAPKKKGIASLPKEAQEAFARFKKQMPNFTEEEYVKLYGEM
jgi:hypothetical protein